MLRFWSSRPVRRGQEALAREFHLRLLVLLCVEEVARASTSSHLLCQFGAFMVHRDVPPVTSSQQFLGDLATHLRITMGFTIHFDLKEHFSTHLLVPHRGAGRPRRGSGTGPLCHGAGERWTASLCGTSSRP